MTTALLALLLATALRAEARVEPITIHVQAGRAQEVLLDFGVDDRPNLLLRAELAHPDPSTAGGDDLTLAIAPDPPNDREPNPGAVTLSPGPTGHRTLLVRATASRSAERAIHRAEIILTVPGAVSTMRVPLVVDIAPSQPRRMHWLLPLSVGLAVFSIPFVSLLWAKSTFLDPARLAGQITPLRSSSTGHGIEIDETRRSFIPSRIRNGLTTRDRLRCWLDSRPWCLLWSDRPHREVVHITPNSVSLAIRPIPEARFDANDRLEPGLYAVATDQGTARLFLQTDSQGRLYDLRPERGLDRAVDPLTRIVTPLRLVRDLEDEPADGPMGWEVRP